MAGVSDAYITFKDPNDEDNFQLFLFVTEISHVIRYEGRDKDMKCSIVMKNGDSLNTKYTVKEMLELIMKVYKENGNG